MSREFSAHYEGVLAGNFPSFALLHVARTRHIQQPSQVRSGCPGKTSTTGSSINTAITRPSLFPLFELKDRLQPVLGFNFPIAADVPFSGAFTRQRSRACRISTVDELSRSSSTRGDPSSFHCTLRKILYSSSSFSSSSSSRSSFASSVSFRYRIDDRGGGVWEGPMFKLVSPHSATNDRVLGTAFEIFMCRRNVVSFYCASADVDVWLMLGGEGNWIRSCLTEFCNTLTATLISRVRRSS